METTVPSVPPPEPVPVPPHLPSEDFLAGPMFWLAMIFLIVLGGILHRHKLPDPDSLQVINAASPDSPPLSPDDIIHNPYTTELVIQLWILGCLWPVFLVEGVWRFLQGRHTRGIWPPLRDGLVVALIPPWRMGLRSQGASPQLWLPGLGWQTVNRDLERGLERRFGVPMIFIALLVLPLLVAEFFFARQVRQYFWLEFLVEFGNALVWFCFALEFLIMLAVARHRFRYCLTHWIDMAIILLPFVNFLPVFRLLRLGQVLRLEQLTRLGRLYRMQGLALRAWRAFLLLQLIQRILGTSPQRQLERLRELEQAKVEELEELRQEIRLLEEFIAQQPDEAED